MNSSILIPCLCALIFLPIDLYANDSNIALDNKNIVGSWHCRLQSSNLRYEAVMTYQGNRNYNDSGTFHQLINGQWLTLNYQGSGKWSFNPSRKLILSQYKASQISSPYLTEEELAAQNISFNKHHTASAKIIRLGSQMLVYQLDHLADAPTARCTKRSR